jgi:hypothetical protein
MESNQGGRIKMTYELITARNMSEGLHVPLVYINDITAGLFMNIFLFAVWTIFVVGSYFIQKRGVGTGDFPQSLAVGGFVTLVLAIILRLVPGLVSGYTLAVCVIVAGLSILFFLFSRD